MFFDKKKFAELLCTIAGERTQTGFAADCDVSYGYLNAYFAEKKLVPPSPKFIFRIASASGDSSYTVFKELLSAAGYDPEDPKYGSYKERLKACKKSAEAQPPITKDEYYMELARLTARRSKDIFAQNGAVIISSDGRILSMGYNGFPYVLPAFGNNDELYPWGRSDDIEQDKLSYVVHAEANAILNFRGIARELEGAIMYVTQIPCNECAKLIIQSGVKKVVFLNDEEKPRTAVTKKMFRYAGVKLVKYGEE